ncbi:hypothetical protein [Lactiplantibacillus mudanjiangensis]|uniref:Uncharacterized protein n=1 Tax=Lactiplantibacillus mudanjiangensis TaxID=1296538 RepID=A0A660E3D0_9LACO|nr:hypothetical protein [Lactiplantibacillus mudanjiangensis]VDG20698.1 hypothetical protein [Lactobacillus sp. CBA3605] [Lactiplantibacillus mudanjiangensis]VDG24156.1 hypothetical protein [Lactobacillus sp. CBA3605] [Lactiplantibacillus mudanjiangensis]VDG30140.1 hypothetical protein [Lactobacillus sp. CBA3605] [Lactiplantibacillus mudanjiangensis]VDG30624.1 hypothetical protein [Lactobacillus sp. CBA3605] [Lactiplantibacillus mudanjiangensis]
MRLIDFKLSTVDLNRQLPLYWEVDAEIQPIQDLRWHDKQLLLVTNPKTTPLTLDQFFARTQQLNGQAPLLVAATSVIPIFGYRLSEQRLLLG